MVRNTSVGRSKPTKGPKRSTLASSPGLPRSSKETLSKPSQALRKGQQAFTPSGPTLKCPECGTDIPVAEAIEQAVAARTAEVGEAQVRFKAQEARLKADAAARLRELEDRLGQAHAEDLRKRLEAAKSTALQKFQEGRNEGLSQVKAVQAHLKASEIQQAKLKKALAEAESQQAAAQFDQQAAFEKGRGAAMEASQHQLKDLQKLLDEVRNESLKREQELDKRLARATREAEARAAAQGARLQKATLDAARDKIKIELSREVAVDRQRYERQIQRLKQEIDNLQQKADAVPSEVVGEAAEDVLERDLRDAFQAEGDVLARARRGQKAADITLTVARAGGRKLLVESKWTQSWDGGWIAKAKEDRASAGAEAVIIVSRSLPVGVQHLNVVEDVWVASPQTAIVLVSALRQGLIAVDRAKRAANMDESRVQELKAYLGGVKFREQVESLVSLSQGLLDNQTRERTQHDRAWKEARAAFERMLTSALGIWSDLELASGLSLSPGEVVQPYLSPEASSKSSRRKRVA